MSLSSSRSFRGIFRHAAPLLYSLATATRRLPHHSEPLQDVHVSSSSVHTQLLHFRPIDRSRPHSTRPSLNRFQSSHMHGKMGAGLHGLGLEPFPLFIDSSPLPSPKILMNMNGFQLYTPPARSRRPRISIPAKLSNYLQVRYYQYEVTFGLYVMTRTEKIILNTILFTILAGILYGFYVGVERFVVDTVCKIVYITGSNTSAPSALCSMS